MIRFFILTRFDTTECGTSQLVYCRDNRYAEGSWLPRMKTPMFKWLKFNSIERADFIRNQLQQEFIDNIRIYELTEKEVYERPDSSYAA
jgi:hypothetical protein